MKLSVIAALIIVVACLAIGAIFVQRVLGKDVVKDPSPQVSRGATTQPADALNFIVKDIDGNEVNLAGYQGKVVLIVNVASKCGFTKQYAGLEKLYETYKDRGLVVIGFPANNFGGQEPGTDAEIRTFCTSKFNVSFPMMSKISVKGDDKAALYKYLTEQPTAADFAGDIGKVAILDQSGVTSSAASSLRCSAT